MNTKPQPKHNNPLQQNLYEETFSNTKGRFTQTCDWSIIDRWVHAEEVGVKGRKGPATLCDNICPDILRIDA